MTRSRHHKFRIRRMKVQIPPLPPRLRLPVLALILTPLLALALILGVWWAAGEDPIPQRTVTKVVLPAGIPTHFSFGIGSGLREVADLNDMRTRNGTAWDA